MNCIKCGNQMDDSAMYCPNCGEFQAANAENPVINLQTDSTLSTLTEVPYKCNGKSVRFLENHLEFINKSINYDDINTLTTRGLTTIYRYVGIPFIRSFAGSTLSPHV